MNNTENPGASSWDRIQSGVKEAERLIGQKKYNTAMIKSRQTLEFMVKCLCEKVEIEESGLIDMIDALYSKGVINQTTCEHYHKIRTIGNKAVHEEDNSAYNANQAYHLLSQEVYTFANGQTDKKKRPAPVASASRSGEREERRPASSKAVNKNSRRRKASSSGFSIEPGSLIKPLLVIAIIIVLIFIIKMLNSDKKEVPETTAPVVTTEQSTELSTEETEPETTTAAVVMYKTIDTVNVRPKPSTDGSRIGVLAPDSQVEYVKDYDEKWCVIKYNGQDAYAAKEYLKPVS